MKPSDWIIEPGTPKHDAYMQQKAQLQSMPAAEPMHPEDIKAALRKAGITPAAISREFCISDMAVSHVIAGRHKSRRIAQRISQVIGQPIDAIWPGKYEAEAA